ncbi:DUF2721 domain-containing protein [Flagellimonas allohymeniacidonis]|uniref:DUF2721 domain-containing protein n=1 Tax=Flagellimonas allohymeniacidonis TaxID=2517819 RepID=A0A4Q8Q9F6_9FLAO|nr:DUF2721 domain-containing protein [Allomuricauda hymeniacidonis]TAI46841.1 DUF2721 domain-containing protein [Allomuricauda hymeniacidonis]
MEGWYVPITIVPGIGLLLMSTSNLLLGLSNEIKELIVEQANYLDLLERKLRQLKLLNYAMVFLYVSVAFFVISGLIAGLYENTHLMEGQIPLYFSGIGIISALAALLLLIIYAFRAVRIKQDQFKQHF